MSLFEYIVIGGIAVALLISLVVLFRLAGLSRNMNGSEVDQRLVEIQTLLSHFSRQADEREKTIRSEFKDNREEVAKSINHLSDTVRKLGHDQANQQEQFRTKLDEKMKELRAENSQKLDEMRKTVDEKLQTTLERRLSESFKTVSERLEAVQRGLGEMQNLATGVGDLKRVLTNVKSRGTFGEVQLDLLIQDVLTPNQYVENYDCGKPSGQQRVEYGIRMPGTEGEVYLPIDAKFPTEDYERLLSAVEAGDVDAIATTQKTLMNRIRGFAKDISTKYINPPYTTTTAILFLPTEGLYAELLRSPGFVENLQRDFNITVTGPTNFQVLLTTFRMGYQQMAMQEHAAEVWKVLGAVKSEFGKYGEQINLMGKNVKALENHIDKLETRKNVMLRALKTVDEIEDSAANELLE
ncbi:DNA recombination protein RmuC [Kordiimonas aquimaris]|uniref:DNA recombination protein RmuC n=1 Tax=Kordiimonas aquimaris TaxID=707591 RepID=UPI0021CFD81C|nr:DNA recombination protein RmuC [Kordiimonas aquimaris]